MADEPYPLMAREFTDFDQSTLPAIPADWQDSSWHNDACPSFTIGDTAGAFLHVFIDYADPDERELSERYSLSVVDEQGDWTDLLRTDDWPAILEAVRNHV
jgi:hypothetical protein